MTLPRSRQTFGVTAHQRAIDTSRGSIAGRAPPGARDGDYRGSECACVGGHRDDPVHPLLDQLHRRIVLSRDHHHGTPRAAASIDHEPVPLPPRGQHEAERAPQRRVDPLLGDEARARRRRPRVRARRPGAAPRAGRGRRRRSPSADPGICLRASRNAGTSAVTRFSGMWRPANTITGSAGSGSPKSVGPSYSPSEPRHRAVDAELEQPPLVQPREAERPSAAHAGRARWTSQPSARRAGRGTRASSARLQTSCQSTTMRKPRKRPHGRGGEHREVRERRRVDDVVAAAVAERDAASTPSPKRSGGVSRRLPSAYSAIRGPTATIVHAGDRGRSVVPLTQGQVRDRVAVLGESPCRGSRTTAPRRRPCRGRGSRRRGRSSTAGASVPARVGWYGTTRTVG